MVVVRGVLTSLFSAYDWRAEFIVIVVDVGLSVVFMYWGIAIKTVHKMWLE